MKYVNREVCIHFVPKEKVTLGSREAVYFEFAKSTEDLLTLSYQHTRSVELAVATCYI